MSAPSREVIGRLVKWACRGPSVHNTQPWWWRLREDGSIELWADRDRQLRVADPDGRNLAISCGAALHHLIVAGRAMGLSPDVELVPRPDETNLLAHIRLTAGRPASDATETLDALERRCTDRRRFTSWPIPETRLTHLAHAAAGWGADAVPILGVSAHLRTELLLSRALTSQESDARFAQEQHDWTNHSAVDGIPLPTAAPAPGADRGRRPNRFSPEPPSSGPPILVEGSDGLMAICTTDDDQRSWLESGQALSALWLQATRDGLSLVPLSQAIEVEETRNALRHDVFSGTARPQLLIRIGWQEIARATLPPTPRRPVSDVLLPSSSAAPVPRRTVSLLPGTTSGCAEGRGDPRP